MRLITRRAWGAVLPTSVSRLSPSAIDTLYFHYTASDADEQADHQNCGRRVKGVQH